MHHILHDNQRNNYSCHINEVDTEVMLHKTEIPI